MSNTWRAIPKGRPKQPRPPQKGGQINLIKKYEEEKQEDDADTNLVPTTEA